MNVKQTCMKSTSANAKTAKGVKQKMLYHAILSNPAHPEYGVATIPFPFPSFLMMSHHGAKGKTCLLSRGLFSTAEVRKVILQLWWTVTMYTAL